MNIITRGTNNTLYFTLSERITLANPYFLVKMTCQTARTTKIFILPAEQSSYTYRYNKFTITETSGTEILTSGVITLKPQGFWDYEVYEQLSSTNLTPANADNTIPLEVGIIKVTGTGNTYTGYDSQNKNYTIYGGGST